MESPLLLTGQLILAHLPERPGSDYIDSITTGCETTSLGDKHDRQINYAVISSLFFCRKKNLQEEVD